MQWPIPPFPTRVSVGSEAAVSSSGATVNTKGSWITLISGLSTPGAWINLGTSRVTSVGDRSALIDLGIGAAGSETVVVSNLVMGFRSVRGTLFPLHIPAGATLRARVSTSIANDFVRVRTHVFHGEPDCGMSVPGRVTTYGAATATSGGTGVSPPGTANVKGSYAQLTSATTAPIHALMVLAQGSTSGSMSNIEYLIDIAVGASGSETIIVPDFAVFAQDDEYIYPRSHEFLPLSTCIPAGVRLSARCLAVNSNLTTAIELAVYGFTY